MSAVEATIVDDVLEVETGDEVRFGTNYRDWANLLVVAYVTEPIEWDVPLGENWYTRDLQLQTGRGTRYLIEFRSHGQSRCYSLNDGEKHSHNGFLRRLERIGSVDEDESGTSTEDDTTSESDSESEAENDVLEEEATDDTPTDIGDDVQDEQDDPDQITVDAVDDAADSEIELPSGVTADDVKTAVDEHETLGDVGEAIGVTRGRARTITVALGCYGDVRDLPAGGRGQLTGTGWIAYAAVCLLTLAAAAAISTGVIVP